MDSDLGSLSFTVEGYTKFISNIWIRRYTYRFHPESLAEFLTSLSEPYHIQAERSALTEILSNKYLTDIITLFLFNANTHDNKESVTP